MNPRLNFLIGGLILVMIFILIWNTLIEDENIELDNSAFMTKTEVGSEVKEKVKVTIYYETLCPDSRHFIIKNFQPFYNKYHDRIDLQLVPFGKADYNFGGKLNCQHGQAECLGNKVHSCLSHKIPNTMDLFNFVACMIDDNVEPETVADKCARQLNISGLWESVKKDCYRTPIGDRILRENGDRTKGVSPSITFIPTITINGDVGGQAEMLKNFTKFFCAHYGC